MTTQGNTFGKLKNGHAFQFEEGGPVFVKCLGGFRPGCGGQLHACQPRVQVLPYNPASAIPKQQASAALTKKKLNELRSLVQVNDHGGAYLCAAKALGHDDLAERFDSINRRHLELGHMPPQMYAERYSLYEKLLAFARGNMPAAAYEEFHACL